MEKRRDYYWDNAKLALIFLVVLGHFLLPVHEEDRIIEALYYWIYLFHMPVFVFVSGYFSKSYVSRSGKRFKLTGYVTLYLLLNVCLWAVKYLLNGKFDWTTMFIVTSAQWYMIAMFFWLLMIPYVVRFSFPAAFSVSIAAALLAGAFPYCGNFLALSRVVVFFPFFLLGYYYRWEFFQKCGRWIKCLSLLILAGAFVILFFFKDGLEPVLPIMYGRFSYRELGVSTFEGIALRAGWYCVTALIGGAYLCLIPNRRFAVTAIGERTLGIYFVHRLIRDVFRNLDLYRYMGSGWVLLLSCLAVSAAVTYISSAKIITEYLSRLFRLGFPVKPGKKTDMSS